jgi:DNA invertase Pin-like site-specific DNA recombinase
VANNDVILKWAVDRIERSLWELRDTLETLKAARAGGPTTSQRVEEGLAAHPAVTSRSDADLEAWRRERRREGIARAKAEGKYTGRQPTARRKADEIKALAAAGAKREEIAQRLGVSIRSVYRQLALGVRGDAASLPREAAMIAPRS